VYQDGLACDIGRCERYFGFIVRASSYKGFYYLREQKTGEDWRK